MKFFALVRIGASEKDIIDDLILYFREYNGGEVLGQMSDSKENLEEMMINYRQGLEKHYLNKNISKIQYEEALKDFNNYEIKELTLTLTP